MDILGTREQQSNGILTVTLTLNSAPTSAKAITCSPQSATGGLWGAEFWASSSQGSDNFYLAYRDNPPEAPASPAVEAGRVNHLNALVTSLDFGSAQNGTLGGTCLSAPGVPTTTAPCTLILTTSLSSLGIKPGTGLYSITGLSVYYFGKAKGTFTNLNLANNEEADAATAFDDNGTGTTTK